MNNTISSPGSADPARMNSSPAVREAPRIYVQYLCYLTNLHPPAQQPLGSQHPLQAAASAGSIKGSSVGSYLTPHLSVPGSQIKSFPVVIETVSSKNRNKTYLLTLSPQLGNHSTRPVEVQESSILRAENHYHETRALVTRGDRGLQSGQRLHSYSIKEIAKQLFIQHHKHQPQEQVQL